MKFQAPLKFTIYVTFAAALSFMVLGGSFHTASSEPVNEITRLPANLESRSMRANGPDRYFRFAPGGRLDPTFSGDGKLTDWLSRGDEWARGIANQEDGKIVVAGYDSQNSDFLVVRYNSDGSLDPTFGDGGKVLTDVNSSGDMAEALAIQPDGRIVVAGSSYVPGDSFSSFAVVRYNTDGTLDTSFGSGGKVATNFGQDSSCGARSVAVQSDGKVVAAGRCLGSQSSGAALARYNSDGTLDLSFGTNGRVITTFGVGGFGVINSVALQGDGRIVAAGSSAAYLGSSGSTVFRYNYDGSPDTSFDGDGIAVTTGFDSNGVSAGRAVAIQGDGKIVSVGMAILITGRRAFAFARFNSNGSLDTKIAININGWDEANSLAIQPDGKIVAAGSSSFPFPPYGPFSCAVVRLNANFSRDFTFGSNGVALTLNGPGENGANSVAIQPDGKIVAAGGTGDHLNADITVIRHNSNGSLDTSFDGDGKVTTDLGNFRENLFSDVAILPDGKILTSGKVRLYTQALARYLPDGSPDTTFGGGTGKVALGLIAWRGAPLAVQPDGKIVLAGAFFDDSDGSSEFTVHRYHADGSVDTTFGIDGAASAIVGGGSPDARSILIQPDGRIVVAGTNGDDLAIARFNLNGTLDTTFEGDGIVITPVTSFSEDVRSLALQPDGKIVAAGYSRDNSLSYFTTVRYNADGSLDTSFDGDGIMQTLPGYFAEDVAVQPDGKIIVAGCTSAAGEVLCDTFAVSRYNPDGSADPTFDADGTALTSFGGEAHLRSIAIQSDGKILAAGYSGEGSQPDFTIVRYRSNGSPDTAFGSGDGIEKVDFNNSADVASSMALDGRGRAVVVGGSDEMFAIARVELTTPTAPFDYDGDGKTDFSVYRPSNGTWYVARSQTSDMYVKTFWSYGICPADYDGDGKTDIATADTTDGTLFVFNSSTNTISARNLSFWVADRVLTSDFDGDGKSDPGAWTNGSWDVEMSRTGSVYSQQWGVAGDKAVPADYDGDGKAELAVFRPSEGKWYIANIYTGATTVIAWGVAGDIPVAGDYNGDGRADYAVYRPSNNNWYRLHSNDYSINVQTWGAADDRVTPGDYDGDGRWDAAVFRPSEGRWYVLTASNAILVSSFGQAGDVPTPSSFLY
jgi:uncharacterized delta-60 repeat protein